jgi:hypothetical protein
MQLGGHHVRYEAEAGHQEHPGHGSAGDASWVYGGHDHSFESGGKLGGSDAPILSGSHESLSDGLMKHSIDHTSGIGNGGDYSHVLSEDHGAGTGGDYNHIGHGHVLSAGQGGEVMGGHSTLDHESDKVSSENYGRETVGGQGHVENGLAHYLSEGYLKQLEGGHGHGHVLSVNYGGEIGDVQNHKDIGHDHLLTAGHGDERGNGHTSSYTSNGHDHTSTAVNGVKLGNGHLIQHSDGYDSSGGFAEGMQTGHGLMKYVSNNDGYKVHENVREDDQDATHQNYGIDNHVTADIGHIDQTTVTHHGGPSVDVESNELDGQEHKHLNKGNRVTASTYSDAIRDFWYDTHSSGGKGYKSFEHSV